MQRRRWTRTPDLPPAPLLFAHPLRVPGGSVAGAAMAAELPADGAVWAFMALRAVHAWAAGDGTARLLLPLAEMERWEEEVLAPAYEQVRAAPPGAPLLLPALGGLVSTLRRPEDAAPEDVSRWCLLVVEWALTHGAPETALAFAQAAALAHPDSPGTAWAAGRMLRNRGRMREAEAWLKRAVRVAVWKKDWEGATLGLSSLGALWLDRGDLDRAEHLHLRALQSARRHRLRRLEGEILHGLFGVEIEKGDRRAAERYARKAYEVYRDGHERLPMLAHDIACFWMNQGYFARALPVLRELVSHFQPAESRFRVIANFARAAGACSERDLFEKLWSCAWDLAPGVKERSCLASGLSDLGMGAASLDQWAHAHQALSSALSVASERGEEQVVARAEAAMEAVRRHQSVDAVVRPRRHKAHDPADLLAADLVLSLQAFDGRAAECGAA